MNDRTRSCLIYSAYQKVAFNVETPVFHDKNSPRLLSMNALYWLALYRSTASPVRMHSAEPFLLNSTFTTPDGWAHALRLASWTDKIPDFIGLRTLSW